MTSSKNTKRALLASVLSVVLCCAMLIGSTFAWFTDSVTNTGNRIQAGKLEIDLLMDKAENGSYTSIADGKGDIFDEAGMAQNSNETLWEPGKTQIVYLGVQNKGSLALKYNILLDVTDNGLAGALEYAVLDGAQASDLAGVTDWEALKAMKGAQTGDIAAGRTTAAPNGCLDEIANSTQDETDYFALAVHMKEDAGNEYQDKDITIDVTVVATQATAEEDGFGNDQYDKDAEYPTLVTTGDELQAIVNNATAPVNIMLTNSITTNNFVIPADKDVTLDLNGRTVTNAESHTILNKGHLTLTDSSADKSGQIISLKGNTAALRNGDNAVCVVEGGTISRDGANGNTWHVVENFGKMTFNGGKVVLKNGNGFAITNGWNYIDPGASTTHAVMEINALELDTDSSGIKNCRYGDLTVNDVTVTSTGFWALSNDYLGTAVINGGTLTSKSFKAVSNGAAMTVNGGTFNGTVGLFLQSYATSTVLNGGTFANMKVDELSSYVGTGHTAQPSGTSVIIK